MIEKMSLEKSEVFHNFYEDEMWPIKADYMLKLNGVELYYNKRKEIIYVDDLSIFEERDDSEILSKEELNELFKYLKWDDYVLGLHHTSPESSTISFKKVKCGHME